MPRRFEIDVRTGGGNIALKDTVGSVKLNTSGGDVSANNLDGVVSLRTSGGSITADKVRGDVEAKTSGGDVRLLNIDGNMMREVFLNIIVNAAHAIADSVKGTDKRGTISVRTRREADAVVISIGDSGNGIPSAIHDRLFDPFFTTKAVGQGTGQGLAISRSIVDKHGGRIWFDTKAGTGTTFHIKLPIGLVERQKEAA